MAFVQLSGSFYLPTMLLICCHATNKGIVVMGVWSNHAFIIYHIFSCSFGNKRMCLLTRVYSMCVKQRSNIFGNHHPHGATVHFIANANSFVALIPKPTTQPTYQPTIA